MKHLLKVKLLLLFIALFPTEIFSQLNQTPHIANDTPNADHAKIIPPVKPVPLKDLADVAGSLLGKNKTKKTVEDSTRRIVFSGVAAVGYTLQTRLAATVAGNIAFRPNPQSKLSTITSNITYTQNKQFFWPIQSTIWSMKNSYAFVGDFRYYKYPQSTFGLGTDAPIANEDPMDYKFLRLYEVVLKQIKGEFFAGIGYIIDYRWGISNSGLLNADQSDFIKYGAETKTVSSGFTLNVLSDTRDNPINAMKGLYTSIQFRNNLKAFGSTRNWQSLIVDLRKYAEFPAASDNVLAFWSYNWLVLSGRPPYLDLPSNGWDSYSSTGRGYIQGRFRGAQMVYGESEYRFKITRNGLFGGVVFGNAQTFSGMPGSDLQKIRLGYGTGLRVKIKKTSRTNLAIDYGFGTEGSKGLFISVGEFF